MIKIIAQSILCLTCFLGCLLDEHPDKQYNYQITVINQTEHELAIYWSVNRSNCNRYNEPYCITLDENTHLSVGEKLTIYSSKLCVLSHLESCSLTKCANQKIFQPDEIIFKISDFSHCSEI
jgi:hypothetical protein